VHARRRPPSGVGADPGRDGLAAVAGMRQAVVGQRAQGLLREIGGRRVDGREVRGLRSIADVVRGDLEAVPVALASQPQSRAGGELRLEPRLVEPGGADLAGLVGDMGGEDVETTATAARHPPHRDLQHGLVLAEEARDRPLLRRRLVAPRPVGEDVADRRDAQSAELPSDRRSHPGQRVDVPLERLGPRHRARPRQPRGRVHPAEAGGEPGAGRRGSHRSESTSRSGGAAELASPGRR
jgi:hypothetical protein